MPANKNALIRYKTIDNCLRNVYRRWTLDDLVEACSNALYDAEGISKGVSLRTVQGDLQVMRSDKLGYNAPIEVYEHKYYRYADPEYSIMNMPMSQNDFEVMQEAVDLLRQLEGFDQFSEMADVVSRLQDQLSVSRNQSRPIIHFDSVRNLKGLQLLNPLYNHIAHRQTLRIYYQSFKSRRPLVMEVYPHLLKEFRNRWFVYCSRCKDMVLYNLALDRIQGIEPIDEPYRDNPNFDPEHFFDDIIGVTKNIGNKPSVIRFQTTSEQSKYVITKPLHPSQRLVCENEDKSCVFELRVIPNLELYSVLLSYGPGIKVLSPRFVRMSLVKLLSQSLDLYNIEKP